LAATRIGWIGEDSVRLRNCDNQEHATTDAFGLFGIAVKWPCRDYLLFFYILQAQLSVIANDVIISRLLYALPAWGGFLSVELVKRINAFFDVCSVLAISSVV